MSNYQKFLENKIQLAPKAGFAVDRAAIHPILKPHQADVVQWALVGGCRAGFLNFGLGKTIIQLECGRQIAGKFERPVLFVCPLAVRKEFLNDGRLIGIDRIDYIVTTEGMDADCSYFITNYERIRKGQIDPAMFQAVFFDEASILRNLDTETTQTILATFQAVPYRYVFTATPAPNEYLEFINYAEYLGIMDRGQALTRFFKRNSTTAGNLTLFERREKEFWLWMASWACFVTSPADLGHDATGYALPPLTITPHRIVRQRGMKVDPKTGQASLLSDATKSLPDAAREKKESIGVRLDKMAAILGENPDDHYIIWHHLETERAEIQKRLGPVCKSVYGSQNMDEREEYMEGFAEGRYQYVSTKPEICGSGVNWQRHCHRSVFVGINYKFNDWIQAIHRNYRFLQTKEVFCDLIYTDAEDDIYKELMRKWADHVNAQNQMTTIIKTHGLNADLYNAELRREMFSGRQVREGDSWTFVNNDCVAEWETLKDDSLGLIVTSIPFGNHYEYSENYNCFGHNESNEAFFDQMDFLIPNLYRTLKPGRLACIHVKDRIRYSYMNGTGFSSIDPFSDDTVRAFRKHGFHLMARITVDTDVVRENNGTYRLTWTEACKDMSKMGAGLPEYVLVFRKAPTSSKNAYADDMIVHSKADYSVARWQLDAHAHWKTSGERLMSTETLKRLDLKAVMKLWKQLDKNDRYDYRRHVEIAEKLDEVGRLSKEFMAIPPQSNHADIWDDITRMRTLNATQVSDGAAKHICPLQLDIIERCIERYSNPGDVVADPFGGIGSVGVEALRMGRRAFLTELNSEYWGDGVRHLRGAEQKQGALTLFDYA